MKKLGFSVPDITENRFRKLCDLTTRKPSSMFIWMTNKIWDELVGSQGNGDLVKNERPDSQDTPDPRA